MDLFKDKTDEQIFIKILTNKASQTEEKNFREWLQRDINNLNEFQQFKSMWEGLDNFPVELPDQQIQWEKFLFKLAEHKKSLPVSTHQKQSSSWIIRAAALIIIGLGVFILMDNYKKNDNPVTYVQNEPLTVSYHTLITKRGEKVTLPLSDGTVVYLNSETKLVYPKFFASDKREIKIEGEAYFIVQHNASKPFFVESGNSITEVTGTEFNVYNRNKNIKIVVSSGSVKIHPKEGTKTQQLQKGEMLTLDANGNFSGKTKADLNFQLAWRENKLAFSQTPLSEVMSEIERCFNVKVIFKDSSLKNRSLTGTFEATSLSKTISLINLILDINITQKGQNLLIN